MIVRLPSWLIASLCTVTIISCNRGFTSSYDVRGLRLGEPAFPIAAAALPDSGWHLSFALYQPLRVKNPDIQTVYVVVRGADAAAAGDTIDMDLTTTSGERQSPTRIVYGDAIIPFRSTVLPDQVEVSVVTPSDHLVFTAPVTTQDPSPVMLRPLYRFLADGTVELGAHVRRIYRPDGEYLPSTEDVRVIVLDATGTVVWRSDAGLMFSTMITTVQPQEPGAQSTVSAIWNGKTSSGTIAPPGTYTADVIIPAKPLPYQTTVSFPWPK